MSLQSDLTWTLLQPSNIIFLLLLLGFLCLSVRWYAPGRRLVGLALLLAALPALFPLPELLARPLETRVSAPTPLPDTVDGIVILGGAVDWAASRTWEQLSVNGAGERLLAANALARRYPEAELIFTGLFQDVVPNDFVGRGGDRSFFSGPVYEGRDIVYLGAARSTFEEALLSIDRVNPQVGERWLLVTSAWHMPRALGTFRAQGWTLIPYPVDYRSVGQGVTGGAARSLDIMGRLAALDEIAREWGALFIYNRLGRTERLLPRASASVLL